MSSIQAQAGYKASKNYEILHGEISQSDAIFNLSANKQCTAMCAVAIASAQLQDPSQWNKTTITQIVLRGNLLYNVRLTKYIGLIYCRLKF